MGTVSMVLALVALPLAAANFYFFTRTIRGLSADDQQRLARQPGKLRNVAVIGTALVFLLVLDQPLARLGVAFAVGVWAAWATVHYQRQIAPHFPAELRRRLLRSSLLSGISTLLMLLALVLR